MVPPLLIVAARIQSAAPVWSRDEVVSGIVGMTTGLATAGLVHVVARRMPWPRPFRVRFLASHVALAAAAAALWGVTSSAIQALVLGGSVVGRVGARWSEFAFLGVIAYALVVGVTYAAEGAARAARAEALAARTQLAALRAQLHPHFLFNALHTVVQLIPVDPVRAADAAELVAELLRTTLEEQRDEVPLDDEWRFVSRYLAVERIRFGDRLTVRAEVAPDLLAARVPAFALQTLVENAVQHGAAPRVAATEIVVTAAGTATALTLAVRNTGDGGPVPGARAGTGTGLSRLRERLAVLHGGAATLACGPTADGGFEAVLVVPRQRERAS